MTDRHESLSIDQVIDALRTANCNPKKSGSRWQAKCPAHDDDNPSLSVAVGSHQAVIVKCHAGCEYQAIMTGLGLWKPNLHLVQGGKGNLGEIIATYEYGPYQVVRFFPKTFRQRRPDPDEPGNWIWNLKGTKPRLYHQDTLEPSVIIVEGEKDVDRLRNDLGWPATCNSGGAGKWRSTHLKALQTAKVKQVIVIADNDQPNKKTGRRPGLAHARQVAASCREGGIRAQLLQLPVELGDVSDFLDQPGGTEKHATALAALCKAAPEWTPEAETEAASTEAADHLEEATDEAAAKTLNMPSDQLHSNQHYRLLGLAGDHVAIRISAGRVLQRSREAMCSANTLVAIAPAVWWHALAGIDSLSVSTARAIGDGLLRASDRMGAVDLTTIYGRGAARTRDRELVWHLGDRILRDGQEYGLEDSKTVWLAEPRIDLVESATRDQVEAVMDAVMAYRWGSPEDGRRMLGWLAAAVAAGALEWRPHLLLTAPAGRGKSWLLREVVARLLGQLGSTIADGTAPSVARMTAASSLPITIDEAEPGAMTSLLGLLRIASGGDGLRIRADASPTGVTVQAPRFAALLSATSVPDMNAADASRISLVRLGPPVADWPGISRAIIGSLEHADGIRSSLIRDTAAIADHASKITMDLQAEGKITSREALTAGALSAGWAWWSGDQADRVVGTSSRPEADDAADAIMELLALVIRLEGGGDGISALAALKRPSQAARVADLLGMRKGSGALLIDPSHKGLRAKLRRTRLEHTDLRQLLIQIEGVEYTDNARRFGALRKRAISIPREYLEAAGIDLADESPSAPRSDDDAPSKPEPVEEPPPPHLRF